ncbi:uncharacterized protein B0I36DRAFT_144018 [Microdochium trichocladiopsis]|uniref:DNA polymerase kappa n=1 Tax=Microdochium trichocladiopsis TaxID=1682393 RepID=A0A9P8Y258_9PEZI|nr:uncharacterized protein B0I36DRAFT_144018 [Microdochium trichocladiopsis]KAH7027827.1 hypothetical protein B0I36DRAFT_144018 [Microdochium trichocladiopsis]
MCSERDRDVTTVKTSVVGQPSAIHRADMQQFSREEHETLKYHLLGPSLTKAGQDAVDQSKVSEIIYSASKGSKYFNREEEKDKILTQKITNILHKKRQLERADLTKEARAADHLIAQLELSRDLSQHIVHVDCDAFYAAVEQLDRPELKDVPFAVGAGVLTTCNYLARKFGCRSGMAGFVAMKLCPNLELIRPNFDKYTAKAREVREILADYDPRFESASIDEAYLNITQYCADRRLSPEAAVQQMRDEICQKTNITVSAGIAANAKLAKICSNMNKPNGQYLLPNDRNTIMTFMRDLPTRKVNGIGRVLERELQEIDVKTCGDIWAQRHVLRLLFGDKTYEFLMMVHLGLGRTHIQPAEEYERKSVGTESTFRDMSDGAQLREKLRWTADELEKDMRRAEVKGRTLVLKVKLHTYEVLTRQVATPKAVFLADDLYHYSLPILSKLEQEIPAFKLRLMGLRCTHLVSMKKPDTRAFFGLRPPRPIEVSNNHDNVANDKVEDLVGSGFGAEGDWESWGEEDLALLDRGINPGGYNLEPDCAQNAAEEPYRHHGKEIIPNPKRKLTPPEDETWWECPICGRPQSTNERLFNEHIDLCLSRQAIRDTVQIESARSPTPVGEVSDAKRLKHVEKRKRARIAPAGDPKQKKLSFGSAG